MADLAHCELQGHARTGQSRFGLRLVTFALVTVGEAVLRDGRWLGYGRGGV